MLHVPPQLACGHHSNEQQYDGAGGQHRRVIIGFATAQQQQSLDSHPLRRLPHAGRGRSLLSERLHSQGEVVFEVASHGAGSEQDEDSCSDEGATFEAEDWQWLDAASELQAEETDRSSQCSSQPIPIPASCWFKDEVQRAALDKLNQKRKWYQQQLEAERMMARSMAKSRQAAAASRSNRPPGRPGAPA